MLMRLTKKKIVVVLTFGVVLAGGLIFYAFARTWNKSDIEFQIHINEQLVKESTFGESPTFAIWLEDPETGSTQTIFVTNRAGLGDWEGKTSVPVALPRWFEVNGKENLSENRLDNKIPDQIAVTGATPKPGYFTTRVSVVPGSKWICWIEVNLAGDFNDTYKEYDELNKTSDEYKTGQPALLYKANIVAAEGNETKPEIAGMCLIDSLNHVQIEPLMGITTATSVFDKIRIRIVKPKPRIIEW
jgi:hypothetical protein